MERREHTHEFACPAYFQVDTGVVNEESTKDEDGAVKILQLWLVNDWSQDEVARHQHNQASDENRHLQSHNKCSSLDAHLLLFTQQDNRKLSITFKGLWNSFLVNRITMRARAVSP